MSVTSPVSGVFTATGTSAPITTNRNTTLNLSLSGTWVGSVQVQRSFDGTNWLNASTPVTANVETSISEPEYGTQYRLDYTHTSGTVVYRIAQ